MFRNPVYSFFATPNSLGPFFLRLAVAVVFFYHGTQRVFGWFDGDGWQLTMRLWTQDGGAQFPAALAGAIMVTELIIAAGLTFGFFTRLAGLGTLILVGASLFYFQQGGPGFENLEYPFLLLACGLSLAMMGGGRLSFDRTISSHLLPEISR